jgi:hypothetical protein
VRHIPPDQLLRYVFETCASYDAARAVLETTPVARPVIYTLVGCKPGERCVIERTEEDFCTRIDDTHAANDWQVQTAPWEARIGARLLWTCPPAAARENSMTRCATVAGFTGSIAAGGFAWLIPPVLNWYTRLAVEMCPGRGVLRVAGFENVTGVDLAQCVTETREVGAAAAA